MVGAKNAKVYMEGYSMKFAPHIVKKVWNTAAKLGYANYFISKKTNGITDDHLYVNRLANIPCIDIIHQDPILSQVKLIAEPWDLGEGGYQVGNFPVLWS